MRVNLTQREPAWFQWRQGKISASMMPALMGVNPWCSRNKLWKRVLGIIPEEAMNANMQRGNDLEDTVRELVEERLGERFPAACFEHDEDKWAIASLDGINAEGETILEVKCPAKHETKVNPMYLPQIQWQLYCSGAKKAFYATFTDGQLEIFVVLRDDDYIETLRKEAQLFLNQLRTLEEPEASESDCQELHDEDSIRAQIEYDQLDAEIKLLEDRRDAVRAKLTEKAKDGNIRIGNLIVSKVRMPGTIQYKNIPELKSIDLELYRSAPKDIFRITRKKQ